MSRTVTATMTGFVGVNGGDMLIRAGHDYPIDHPAVVSRPELFAGWAEDEDTNPEPRPRRGRRSADG